MFCTKKVTDDLVWVGANDRRLAMFEGVYSVPRGVSYNSYLLMDEKTVLFDTVDRAVAHRFYDNVANALGDRGLDYIVVQHVEPDHTAALCDLLQRYPNATLVCNAKTLSLVGQFYDLGEGLRTRIVAENDTLSVGRHTLRFFMAPMVHWPEVMVTYDETDGILFSADAFGCFGALNGAMFADEVDFSKDYMDEARRYYTNIVGRYGPQVQSLLKKVSPLNISMICPLHGFVWRKNIGDIVSRYAMWSDYQPEQQGVMIAYASVYGNTENAAEILSCRLRDRGIATVMFDVSVTPASEIVSESFRWSHLVFASTTYNGGIFVSMEALLHDLVAHNIQNRTVAVVENGSWAATSGNLICDILGGCKNITILDSRLSIRSALAAKQLADIDAMTDAIAATMDLADTATPDKSAIDTNTMFKLSYGLFVLTARDGDRDNGCIINTVMQTTQTPLCVTVAVNKANHTHDMMVRTGRFNVSVLTEDAPFDLFKQFGFSSGRDTDKFAGCGYDDRAANGIRYVPQHTNAVISARVTETIDCGTHTLFMAVVTEALQLSDRPSATYQYYFDHIKPKPQQDGKKKGFVCVICGFEYEGDTLPPDYICPLCKHGVEDFVPIGDAKDDSVNEKVTKGGDEMVYVCDVCGYEYNEANGEPENGIAPGTAWENLPDDYLCPLCGVGKDQFTKA